MKITVKTLSDELSEKRDYRQVLEIHVNDEEVFSVSDGEPEDSNLSRDFSDCYSITDLMEQAYLAGKNGESFEVNEEIITEW